MCLLCIVCLVFGVLSGIFVWCVIVLCVLCVCELYVSVGIVVHGVCL